MIPTVVETGKTRIGGSEAKAMVAKVSMPRKMTRTTQRLWSTCADATSAMLGLTSEKEDA